MRLGLLESHFRLSLGEIVRCVLIAGGQLAYGGHLQPSGYSAFLVGELERYRRRDRPFLACLSLIEHRRLSLRELKEQVSRLGLYGKIVCLDADGNVIAPDQGRGEEPQSPPPEVRAQALTALRRFMIGETDGRVFMGGKRSGFTGAMPGLLEEAIMAVEERSQSISPEVLAASRTTLHAHSRSTGAIGSRRCRMRQRWIRVSPMASPACNSWPKTPSTRV